MSFQKTPTFVYTAELDLSQKDVEFFESRERVAVSVYNDCLGESLRRMRAVKNAPLYRPLLEELSKAKEEKQPYRDIKEIRSDLYALNAHCGFSEYSLHEYVKQAKHHFGSAIGIDEAQKLATRAFHAVEKVMYGKSKRVHFASRNDGITIEGKSGKSTLRYKDGKVYFGKKHCFDIVIPRNRKALAYHNEAMANRVKYIRVIKKTIRGKPRYYVQVVLEGCPPAKKRIIGPMDRRVGIDEGVSTAAISSNGVVSLVELAPECKVDAKEAKRLQRKMDRSRRSTNPDNYNDDGTIRNGKKKWNCSKAYARTKAKYQDASRKAAVKRKQSNEELANNIVALGLAAVVEPMEMRALAKRSSKDTKTVRGKNRSKKRYGKTIANRAPAMLVSILERKLKSYGGTLLKTDKWEFRASQLDHTTGEYSKKALNDRIVTVGGKTVQRDMYSAFLLEHANKDGSSVDIDTCDRDFPLFVIGCEAEVGRIRNSNNQHLLWYVS